MALGGSGPRRYAEALLDIATGANAVDELRTSLDRVASALAGQPMRAFTDPSVPLARRLEIAGAGVANEPRTIRAIVALLIQRGRIALLPAVATTYGELVDQRAGIVKAKITTPVELDEAQRSAFVQRLERSSGKKLRATFAVDPSLVGGAKVQLGDHLIDGSIRAQLDRLRTQLVAGR